MMQLRQSGSLVAIICASQLAAAAAAGLLDPGSRALGSLGFVTLVSILAAAIPNSPARTKFASLAVATLLSVGSIYGWRRLIDPMAVVGPVPGSLELPALAVFAAIIFAAAGLVALPFSTASPLRRFRWAVFGVVGLLWVAGYVVVSRHSADSGTPRALMQRVIMLEQSSRQSNWGERQELSTALAILGRQREAREIPLSPDAQGQTLCDPPGASQSGPSLAVVPWQKGMAKIAAAHRLVLIMEAHTVSEQRAWIEQTLGVFRAAGFTQYYAEAIDEPETTLKARGYLASRTGVYTRDPRFGNLVRTALNLGFEVGGYDLTDSDFDRREEHQAATLAKRFASRADQKMMVHAGHAHLWKHAVRGVGRYMGARLWKQTGVEPFTIWQLSNELPNETYREIIQRIGPIREPVLLFPPSRELSEKLFPESTVHPAVDAVVVHPPRIGREPADRRGPFSGLMQPVLGDWSSPRWPVVLAAFAPGEADDAIALDQILLRPGETKFELWLPRKEFTLRAWDMSGPLKVTTQLSANRLRVQANQTK